MASKNFLLVSLEESKARQLAQIITNDVCRRILDYITGKKDTTESEISKELGIPLSTVHYNLKQLLQSGIVKAEEFHYSSKGREVDHYSLANKYIIIAPKATATESLASKLRKILPVIGVTAVTALALQALNVLRPVSKTYAPEFVGDKAMMPLAQSAAEAANQSAIMVEKAAQTQTSQQVVLWFIAGAAVAIAAFILFDYVRSRKASS